MNFHTWLAYLCTELILSITPGPAVLFVAAQGLKYGNSKSIYATAGILTCNLLYFTLAALGLGTLILARDDLFTVIKIAGAVYIAWCGLQAITLSFKTTTPANATPEKIQKGLHSFSQAFFIQASNPKALIFFIALLPQFVDTERNISFQFLILGATSIIPEAIILLCYGWASAKGSNRFRENTLLHKWKERTVGILLLGIALYILMLKHQ